jgi:hypothetical protein
MGRDLRPSLKCVFLRGRPFGLLYFYKKTCFRYVQRLCVWSFQKSCKTNGTFHVVLVKYSQIPVGPKWTQGPSGPRAQVRPGPKWTQIPSGTQAQVRPGPKWDPGPSGTRAQVGPRPKWSLAHESNVSVMLSLGTFAQVSKIDMAIYR